MLRVVWSGLRAQAGRLLLTAAAIAGGAGFLAGTFVYADTARAAFYDQLARSARNTDAVVFPAEGERIPSSIVEQLPGRVDARVVEVLGLLDKNGRLISNEGYAGYATSLPRVAELARYDVTRGRLPARPGEVAIDKNTVARYGFAVGDSVTVANEQGTYPLEVVGVIDLGVHRGIAGLSVVALSDEDISRLAMPTGASEVVIMGASVDAVRAAVPDSMRVMSGDEWRRRLAVDAAKYVEGFHQVLLGFGLIALAVSVFVIFNTFSILTARRTRELALWRCLGAGRARVRLLVLAEAAALGVLGSLAGVLVSVTIGWGLIAGRAVFGTTAVPDHALVVGPSAIFTTLFAGTSSAVLAAMIPAWRAGRLAPLDVLHQAAVHDARPGRPLPRLLGAIALACAGAWLIRRGMPWGFDGLVWIFGGAAVLFGGLILAAPLVVGRLTIIVGAIPARLFGPAGGLALRQARHSPRRAAATTSALMVGVGVLATMSVLLTTAAQQSRKELGENFPVDFTLSSVDLKMGNGKSRVPGSLVDFLSGRPEFAAVTGVRNDLSIVDNSGIYVWSAQSLSGPLVPEVVRGTLSALGSGNAAVRRAMADDRGIALGSRIQVDDGVFTVVAVYDDAPGDGDVLLSWADYAKVHGPSEPDEVLIALAPAVSIAQGQDVLDEALTRYPLLQLSGKAQARAELTGAFDRLLGIFTALLGVALLIALFGIGNTLALSVWERRRESATLRAFGLSRAGLRGMLLLEAVLMALVGGGAGLLFGGAVGWAAATGLIGQYGHGSPVLPWGQFALYLLVAAVAASIAALLPARAAARAPIATALAAQD